MTNSTPAVVIGAGPYGLSVAAHLRARGIQPRVFGDVMSSWRRHMPMGMCLKSTPDASSLSAPEPGFALPDYCASQGIRPLREYDVVPIQLFTQYGRWFQEQLVPDVEDESVQELRRTDRGFHLVLGSGEKIQTPTVVVATGITGVAYIPDELASITPGGPAATGPVSHSSQHNNLAGFGGAKVAVVGAGQSALESAALLHEAGAETMVLARGTARFGTPPKEPSSRRGHAAATALPARADMADLPLQPRRGAVPVPAARHSPPPRETSSRAARGMVAARSRGRPDPHTQPACCAERDAGRRRGAAVHILR